MKSAAPLASTGHDLKSVQEVSKQAQQRPTAPVEADRPTAADQPESADRSSDGKSEGHGKTHVNYWKKRLYRNTFTRGGQRFEVKEWCVKIQHLGYRKTFALKAGNKDVAAAKAKEIYLAVVSKGWAAAEAIYNPDMVVRKDDPSLGDFLAEV